MNINGNHAVAASNLAFMNITVDDVTKVISICIALVYVGIALRDHILKWREKKKNK